MKSMVTGCLVRVLSRRRFKKVVRFLLNVALRSLGYNNYRSLEESGESWFIKRLAAVNGGVCIDVGANAGGYSEQLLLAGFDKVFAYEPHPAHRTNLDELGAAFPNKLHVTQKAVGDAPGHLNLLFNPAALSHASLSLEINDVPYVQNTEAVEVQIVTLDQESKKHSWQSIALLKIDTEGFEAEVLRGSEALLATLPPLAVQIEFNLHQLMKEQSLRSIGKLLDGYLAYQLLPFGNGVRSVGSDEADANFYYFSNFVFVRADFAKTLFPN